MGDTRRVLHYEDTGNPNGVPLVLIHGFLSCNHQWDLNRERLGRELRLILVEQPGHGSSPTPDDESRYGPDAMFAALEGIRADLGLDRWWMGGQSLGGAMAIRYTLAHPERVDGLVFTNSRAAFGLARKERADPPPRITSVRDLAFHPMYAKRFPEDLKQRMVEAADRMELRVIEHTTANRAAWRSADELGRLQVPVLLVNGRWEKAFQPCVAQARAALAALEVVELEGGHSINVEQAEGFDQAVLSFIARHRRDPANRSG